MISQTSDATPFANVPGRRVEIPQGPSYLTDPPGTPFWGRVKAWAFTLDHKRIGVMYLVGILSAFLLGGIMAMLVRLELWTPAADFSANFAVGADVRRTHPDSAG